MPVILWQILLSLVAMVVMAAVGIVSAEESRRWTSCDGAVLTAGNVSVELQYRGCAQVFKDNYTEGVMWGLLLDDGGIISIICGANATLGFPACHETSEISDDSGLFRSRHAIEELDGAMNFYRKDEYRDLSIQMIYERVGADNVERYDSIFNEVKIGWDSSDGRQLIKASDRIRRAEKDTNVRRLLLEKNLDAASDSHPGTIWDIILRIVVIMCGAGAFWFYRVHRRHVPSCCRGVTVDPSTSMEQSSTQKDNLINYNIIDNLPFGYDFRKRTIKELRQYRAWFFDNKQSRLDELNALIHRTPGYADWKMDYSEESLFQLGEFLKHVVEIRPLSPEVYKQRRESTPYYIDVSDWELAPRTISILIDLGMYVGDVLIKHHPGLKWIQYPGRGKIDANYGHMVILINTNNWVNPIRAMYISGWQVAKGTFTPTELSRLYNLWSDSVDVNNIN